VASLRNSACSRSVLRCRAHERANCYLSARRIDPELSASLPDPFRYLLAASGFAGPPTTDHAGAATHPLHFAAFRRKHAPGRTHPKRPTEPEHLATPRPAPAKVPPTPSSRPCAPHDPPTQTASHLPPPLTPLAVIVELLPIPAGKQANAPPAGTQAPKARAYPPTFDAIAAPHKDGGPTRTG
jgi:hypothetical protein